MRKTLLLAALATVGLAQAQTTIFDTISPPTVGYTTSGTNPHFLLGESFGLLNSGAGGWNLQTMNFAFFVFANASAGTGVSLTNVVGTFKFYRTLNTSATTTDPAFLNLAGSVSIGLGTVTQTTANQVFTLTTPVNIAAANINLTDGEKGMEVSYTVNGVATDQITMAMRDITPAVGTTGVGPGGATPNGFWRDNDNNGVANVGDARTLTGVAINPGLALTANVVPVPEPASMAILGLGAAALIRRRRSNKA